METIKCDKCGREIKGPVIKIDDKKVCKKCSLTIYNSVSEQITRYLKGGF